MIRRADSDYVKSIINKFASSEHQVADVTESSEIECEEAERYDCGDCVGGGYAVLMSHAVVYGGGLTGTVFSVVDHWWEAFNDENEVVRFYTDETVARKEYAISAQAIREQAGYLDFNN